MDMKVTRAYNVYDVYKTPKSNPKERLSRAQERSDSVELSSSAVYLQSAHKAVDKAETKSVKELNDIKEKYDNNQMPSSFDIASKIVESSFDKLI